MNVLVTGGVRSGKSHYAEQYAAHLGAKGTYIATAQIHDDEMRTRVRGHYDRRVASAVEWETVEEPYHLSEVLIASDDPIILVDCLTLWLSNWLLFYDYEQQQDAEQLVQKKINELTQALATRSGDTILVTNEVGYGIVPEYKLGRQFRDLSGLMNQQVARVCEQVFLVTSGIPIELKSKAYKL
jgi:adenosylcobinamide kinase/adenosylcobinamide-phosphate guanylyltransferase